MSRSSMNPWKPRQNSFFLFVSVHRTISLDPRLLGLPWYVWVERGGYLRAVDIQALWLKNVWLQILTLLFTRCETFGKYLVFVSFSFFISKMKILTVVSVKWHNICKALSIVPGT